MQVATKATTERQLNTVQCHCIAVHKQLHIRTSCSSFDYRHYLIHSAQNHRKPVSLSGRAFTFLHVLTSSDLSMWFTSPFEGSPDAQKIKVQVVMHRFILKILVIWFQWNSVNYVLWFIEVSASFEGIMMHSPLHC